MGFYKIFLGISLSLLFNVQLLSAQSLSKKEFVYRNAPANAEVTIKKVFISSNQRKSIEAAWKGVLPKDTITFIMIRDAQKKLVNMVCFNEHELPIFRNYYQVGVAMDSNGIITDVGLCGNYDMYGMAVGSKKFLSQYLKKGKEPFLVKRNINGITGATISVDFVTQCVNGIIGTYHEIVKKQT